MFASTSVSQLGLGLGQQENGWALSLWGQKPGELVGEDMDLP